MSEMIPDFEKDGNAKASSGNGADIYNNKLMFIEDSYSGEGGFTPMCNYSYVIPFDREKGTSYQSRRKISSLTNYFAPLINLYLTPVYGAKIDYKTQNANLLSIIDDSKYIKVCNNSVRDLKLYNQSYYGVAFMSTEDLPIFFNIQPKNIESLVLNGKTIKEMDYIEYKQYKNKTIPVTNKYDGSTLISTTKAWMTSDGKITLKETSEGRRLTIFDAFYTDVNIYKNGNNDLNETPDSFQLAVSNYDLFNKYSLINEIDFKNAISVLVIATDSDIKDISLGANNILKVPANVTRMPEFLQIESINHDIIKEDILDLKQYMYKMFSNNLISDDQNAQYTTALSTALATRGYDSEVNYLYKNYKESQVRLLQDCVDYYSIVTSIDIEFEDLSYNVENVVGNSADLFDV